LRKLYLILLYALTVITFLLSAGLWITLYDEFTLNISITIVSCTLALATLTLDHQRFNHIYNSRWFRHLCSTTLSAFLLFILFGLGNYIVYKHPAQLDLTSATVNSLSPQSVKVLSTVQDPIQAKIFARKSERPMLMALLELYRLVNSNFTTSFIDIELRPDLVQQHKIEHSPTLLLEHQGRKQQVLQFNELKITQAIIKLSRPEDPNILYSIGHGELDLYDKDANGGTTLLKRLKESLFKVVPIELTSTDPLLALDKSQTLMIWGPKRPFFNQDVVKIRHFIQAGGSLLIALDPDLNQDRFANLRQMLKENGIYIHNNLVIDKAHFVRGSNGSVPLITKFNSKHPITNQLKGQLFFPLVSSIETTKAKEGQSHQTEILLTTSNFPDSWADNDPKEIAKGGLVYTPQRDTKGPIPLSVALEQSVGKNHRLKQRIVAMGNSTLINNSYSNFSTNFQLILNSLSWLTKDDQLISFNLPVIKNQPIFIGQYQLALVFYLSILLVPLLLLLFAILIYRFRRE
jgi:ABC-type uncharacterized transport system involved in gliding motility auxiliary subunit